MTSTQQEKQPIDDLLSRLLDDKLDDNERNQFMDLLQYDPDARELYHEHIALHAMLHWIDSEPLGHVLNESPLVRVTLPGPAPAPRTPILGFPGNALYNTISYSFDGWPLAYLLATVIVVTGLVIGGLISGPTVTQVAHESSFPAEFWRNTAAPKVGRVTATLDCKWAPGTPVARDGDYVAIGRPFNLDAGLLEITYETGAKVILQGPVTYSVASPNSGFLSSGKLVGKMTTEPAKGFTVRTPTATVVDLGTEFGVEVSEEGYTTSHVFRGSVKLQAIAAHGKPGEDVRVLRENESARVEKEGGQRGGNRVSDSVARVPANEFVRQIPGRTSKPSWWVVVANWQFDGDDFLTDSSGNGHSLVNLGATEVDGAASFNGMAAMRSVDSIDLTPYTKVRVSWSQKVASIKPNQPVWEQSENYNDTPGAVTAYHGETGGLAAICGNDRNARYSLREYPVALDRWENFAVEYNLVTDRGERAAYRYDVVKVFADARLINTPTDFEAFPPASFANAVFYIGARAGSVTTINPGFVGLIDRLKIEGKLRSADHTAHNPSP